MIGQSDRIGAYPASRPYGPGDFATTIYKALGIDPETEVRDRFNRPVQPGGRRGDRARSIPARSPEGFGPAGRTRSRPPISVLLVEVEGHGVDAIAEAGRVRGAIVEEVAEVGAAGLAGDLGPGHPVRPVDVLDDLLGVERAEEAGPAGPRN